MTFHLEQNKEDLAAIGEILAQRGYELQQCKKKTLSVRSYLLRCKDIYVMCFLRRLIGFATHIT